MRRATAPRGDLPAVLPFCYSRPSSVQHPRQAGVFACAGPWTRPTAPHLQHRSGGCLKAGSGAESGLTGWCRLAMLVELRLAPGLFRPVQVLSAPIDGPPALLLPKATQGSDFMPSTQTFP